MLRLRDVTRSFTGRAAVRAVSLDVPRGRTTVLLGESGGPGVLEAKSAARQRASMQRSDLRAHG